MSKLLVTVPDSYLGMTKYSPAMIAQVVEAMKLGKGVLETATQLGVTVDTLYDWTDISSSRYKPELSLALKMGSQYYQSWWLDKGRTSLHDSTFNHVLWYMQMKNRFGWRDTVDVTSAGAAISFNNTIPRPELPPTT